MLDRLSHQLDDIRPQSFSVAYEYPVVFTRDASNPCNHHLVDVVTRREPDKHHRCALFVDAGVMAAIPELSDRAANCASVLSFCVKELVG